MAATAPYPLRCLVCKKDLDTHQVLNHFLDNHAHQLLVNTKPNKSEQQQDDDSAHNETDEENFLVVNVQCEPDSDNLPVGRLILLMSNQTTLAELHSFFKAIWLGCACKTEHYACFIQDGKEYATKVSAPANNDKKKQKNADDEDEDDGVDDEEDNLAISSDDDEDEENEVLTMKNVKIGDLLQEEKDWCEYNFDNDKTSCIGLACVKKFESNFHLVSDEKMASQSLPSAVAAFSRHIVVLVRNYRDVKTQIVAEKAKNSPRVGMCTSLAGLQYDNQGTIRCAELKNNNNNNATAILENRNNISSAAAANKASLANKDKTNTSGDGKKAYPATSVVTGKKRLQ